MERRVSLESMDNRSEIREFLASRRAKLSPQQAGLGGLHSGRRRVPGLRREEVALLAGVSVEYYARLERGSLGGVSESVLDALAGALQLDEAERQHLYDLARTAGATPRTTRRRRTTDEVRPSVVAILESMTGAPAFVRNGRLDLLAVNRLARALFAPAFDGAGEDRPVNLARFVFLDPAARTFHPNWEHSANTTVALLRTEAGRDPYNRKLTDLVGELSTRSDEFLDPLGGRRRTAAPLRRQTLPAPGRRRTRVELRGDAAAGRSRSHPDGLQRRAGHSVVRRSPAPRQPGARAQLTLGLRWIAIYRRRIAFSPEGRWSG